MGYKTQRDIILAAARDLEWSVTGAAAALFLTRGNDRVTVECTRNGQVRIVETSDRTPITGRDKAGQLVEWLKIHTVPIPSVTMSPVTPTALFIEPKGDQ